MGGEAEILIRAKPLLNSMPHGHGIKQQTLVVNAAALSTLAGRSALELNSSLAGIKSTFLLIRFRYMVQLIGRTLTDDGPIALLIAPGDASAVEIATAVLEQNDVGPEDLTKTMQENLVQAYYSNTLVPIPYSGDGTEGVLSTGWRKFGGRGIPAREDQGFTLHAFNLGSGALTTGVVLNGLCQVQGVWLRD